MRRPIIISLLKPRSDYDSDSESSDLSSSTTNEGRDNAYNPFLDSLITSYSHLSMLNHTLRGDAQFRTCPSFPRPIYHEPAALSSTCIRKAESLIYTVLDDIGNLEERLGAHGASLIWRYFPSVPLDDKRLNCFIKDPAMEGCVRHCMVEDLETAKMHLRTAYAAIDWLDSTYSNVLGAKSSMSDEGEEALLWHWAEGRRDPLIREPMQEMERFLDGAEVRCDRQPFWDSEEDEENEEDLKECNAHSTVMIGCPSISAPETVRHRFVMKDTSTNSRLTDITNQEEPDLSTVDRRVKAEEGLLDKGRGKTLEHKRVWGRILSW